MEEARRWAVSRRKTQLQVFSLRNTNSKRQLDEQMVVRKLVVVRPSESHHIHLIGITERGIRLYFSTFPLEVEEPCPRTLPVALFRNKESARTVSNSILSMFECLLQL